ncbi:leucine-rich repeat serine/threonine-protein kinase 1-like [Hyposmocoma kahamanoa]|uniref:leucine-rich repeat serine/threonine-protein kinase 1-like n=1 Tax=Hyposmocoma kahamanoa TaxID=1477025 RepID=UPI000E6D73F6|nr:leucine-rich repeat serine/threonine-protein kinase 1-like [Hyposmocoma kahamanoa]
MLQNFAYGVQFPREPRAAACRAYCALRQELAVLRPLRHPHVAALLAVCAAPLALLLALAPQGALDAVLRQYRGCGARVGPRAARALALQTARALEYLHARRIVYRDLKVTTSLFTHSKVNSRKKSYFSMLNYSPPSLTYSTNDAVTFKLKW